MSLSGPSSGKNIIQALVSNGQVLSAMGKSEEALTFYNRALEMKLSLGNEAQDLYTAFLYIEIAELYFYLNRYEEALFNHHQALEIKNTHYTSDTRQPTIAKTLRKIAKLLSLLKKDQEACSVYEQLVKEFLFAKT